MNFNCDLTVTLTHLSYCSILALEASVTRNVTYRFVYANALLSYRPRMRNRAEYRGMLSMPVRLSRR